MTAAILCYQSFVGYSIDRCFIGDVTLVVSILTGLEAIDDKEIKIIYVLQGRAS